MLPPMRDIVVGSIHMKDKQPSPMNSQTDVVPEAHEQTPINEKPAEEEQLEDTSEKKAGDDFNEQSQQLLL